MLGTRGSAVWKRQGAEESRASGSVSEPMSLPSATGTADERCLIGNRCIGNRELVRGYAHRGCAVRVGEVWTLGAARESASGRGRVAHDPSIAFATPRGRPPYQASDLDHGQLRVPLE